MYTHRINKVSLDFSFQKKEKDTALQTARQLFYDIAIPQLNEVFNTVQERLLIDRMEIDLGKTTPQTFRQDFLAALKIAFEKQRNIEITNPGNQVSKSNDLTTSDVLFFIESGYWPWNLQQEHEPELSIRLKLFFANEAAVILLLQNLTAKQLPMAERLIHLASSLANIRKLFIRALTNYHSASTIFFPLLMPALNQQLFITGHFYFYFVSHLIIAPPQKDLNQIILFASQLINQYAAAFHVDKPALDMLNQLTKAPYTQNTIQLIAAFITTHFVRTVDHFEANNQYVDSNLSPGLSITTSTETEKISILNGGLILFHPYLLPVFRDLKWLTKDNQFLNPKTQQKAVLFLQYLVNGKSRQAEHLLVLNKILCNWPVQLPLPNSCTFSAREKIAAMDLIESFREHWTVMKNTSNSGLVESFIARPGLVQKKPDGFLLQIERKTIDILMDSLPYGINTIKLPWNEYFIYTEW